MNNLPFKNKPIIHIPIKFILNKRQPVSGNRCLSSIASNQTQSQVVGNLLHHEWIIDGKVTNNNNAHDQQDDSRRTVIFLHGLLGNGKVSFFLRKIMELYIDSFLG